MADEWPQKLALRLIGWDESITALGSKLQIAMVDAAQQIAVVTGSFGEQMWKLYISELPEGEPATMEGYEAWFQARVDAIRAQRVLEITKLPLDK